MGLVPGGGRCILYLFLTHRLEVGAVIDVDIIPASVGIAKEQKTGLIDAVDDPVRRYFGCGAGNPREGREQVGDVDHVAHGGAGFDCGGPAQVCVHTHPALEHVRLAAPVHAVADAANSCVLHEWAVVAHDHHDGVVGDTQPVDLGHDLTDPLVDLDNGLGNRPAVQRLSFLDI